MNPIFITATTISDAWFQCLYNLIEEVQKLNGKARRYTVTTGSMPNEDRIEFDFATIHITQPGVRPLLPQAPEQMTVPWIADEQYLAEYMPYLLSPEKHPNEHYTYGERIMVAWDFVIDYYRKHGDKNNRMCMEVGCPEDIKLYEDVTGSSPCLRLIDTRIKNNKLHWFLYFRSWDLMGGFPINLAGLQQAKELMAYEIGVEDGTITAMSKGLNIRSYNIELALTRLQRFVDKEIGKGVEYNG
jgi:thymidylate synthase